MKIRHKALISVITLFLFICINALIVFVMAQEDIGNITIVNNININTNIAGNQTINTYSEKEYSRDEILLNSRHFRPELGINENTISSLEMLNKEKVHILMQFERIPSKKEKEFLKKKGIELLSYIPDKAWFVSVPSNNLQNIAKLDIINAAELILPEDKISTHIADGNIGSWAIDNQTGNVYLIVQFHKDVSLDEGIEIIKQYDGILLNKINTLNALTISVSKDSILQLAQEDSVQWIDEVPPPIEKTLSSSVPNIGANIVQNAPYNLNGSGIDVLVYDDPVYNHPDLVGRITNAEGDGANQHATLIAGIIGGNGTTDSNYKGIAKLVNLTAYNLTTGYSDYNSTGNTEDKYGEAINMYDVDLATNSWVQTLNNLDDCSYAGDYESVSQLFDNIILGSLNKSIPIIVTVGNNKVRYDNCGTNPKSWDNYAVIQTPAGAKNIISVGATNSDDDSMTNFSAWGPVDDGRIKPDVVAPGCEGVLKDAFTGTEGGEASESIWSTNNVTNLTGGCGTSFAAPHVAGTLALMLQQYKLTYGSNAHPLPSTMKAILIHTAKDLNNSGPDYSTGWGRINATYAIDTIISKNLTEYNFTATGEKQRYRASVPSGASFFKVTLVWDDEPGTLNAYKELVNDLDLVLIAPNQTVFYPWSLNPDVPQNPATTDIDSVNNVEQVYISNASAGEWIIQIRAPILTSMQNYSLVSSTNFSFIENTAPTNATLTYPDGGNNISVSTIINWTPSTDAERDHVRYFLQYSDDSGSTWNDIISNYGYRDKLSDNSTEKILIFSHNETKEVYIAIPFKANVSYAEMYLIGYDSDEYHWSDWYDEDYMYSTEGWCSGDDAKTRDENWATYAYADISCSNEAYTNERINLTGLNTSGIIISSINYYGRCTHFNDSSSDIVYGLYNFSKLDYLTVQHCEDITDGGLDDTDFIVNDDIHYYVQPNNFTIWIRCHASVNGAQALQWESKIRINYTYHLNNTWLDVGNDGGREWNNTGWFHRIRTTKDFSNSLNSILPECNCDGCSINGKDCIIPLSFHTDSEGEIKISNINIFYNLTEYDWNTTDMPSKDTYRVRVIASDGVLNSSYDSSNSDFSITHPPNITQVNVTGEDGEIINDSNKAEIGENITFNVSVAPSSGILYNFNNSLSAENLTFSGDENITRYLEIDKDVDITNAYLTIKGYEASGVYENITDDTEDSSSYWGYFDSGYPATNSFDEDWTTYSRYTNSEHGGANQPYIYENFTIPGYAVSSFWNAKFALHDYSQFYTEFYNYSSNNWKLLTDDCSFKSINDGQDLKGDVNCSVDSDFLSSILQARTHLYAGAPHASYDPNSSYYEGEVFWVNETAQYPTKPYINVGNNEDNSWGYYGGEFSSEETAGFTNELNNALNNGACDCSGCSLIGNSCSIPIIFHSNTIGTLEYSEMRVFYNTYSDVDSVWLIIWETIEDAGVELWKGFLDFIGGIWTTSVEINNSFSEITNYTIYANDTEGDTGSYRGNFSVETIEYGENRFVIQNSSSGNIAYFDDNGNIVLKGTCISGGACTAPDDSFIIRNDADEIVAYIGSDGNLCIETGDCSSSSSCSTGNDAFIVKNETTDEVVSYIDVTGDLCFTGSLLENEL